MRANHSSAILTLLLAMAVLAGQAQAAPPQIGGLVQGDDFLVSHAEGSLRGAPAVAYNDDLDEYLVVWVDDREGSSWDIYGQIVTAAGAPRGDNFVVRNEATNFLLYPDVAYDTVNQRYLVVWYDLTASNVEGKLLNSDGSAFGSGFTIADGSGGDMRGFPAVAFHPQLAQYLVVYHGGAAGNLNVYGRRVDAFGTVDVTEHAISTATGNQTNADVSVDPATNGDFLIVWQDGRTATSQIYGRLMYSTWSLGTEFVVAAPTDPVRNPAVAFNPAAGTAGEWLVAFERDVGGDTQIRGRRVTAAGDPTGAALAICDDAVVGGLMEPDVAYNTYGDDQWLVTWYDYHGSDTGYDIRGRRVNVDGSMLGDTFSIFSGSGDQIQAAVASSSTHDGYLTVFVDTRTDDIVGQRVATDGSPNGSSLTLSTPVDDQRQPAVGYNSQDGEYLVVWQDRRAGNWDIWGQRVGLDGSLLGGSLAICSDTNAQLYPDVAYNLDTNQYLVVWEDRRTDADIYGQRVNADGSLDGAEFVIAAAGSPARTRPRVTFNPVSGEYLVVYAYEVSVGDHDIRGRRVPAAGNPSTGEIGIATGATDQNFPDVACRSMEPGGGGYLVAWRDTDGAQRDIRGRRLNQEGALIGGLDICTEASSQWSPAVAYSPDDDRYLVVWPDDRDSATHGRNVYGRQVSGSGTLYTELAISTASGDQAPVAVTYGSGSSSYAVVWGDSRAASTAPDLFGQRVSGSGRLVDTPVGGNDPLYTGPGGQGFPAVAWASDEPQGLLVWEDDRNGASFDIYGLRLEAEPASHIFLPLVIRSN